MGDRARLRLARNGQRWPAGWRALFLAAMLAFSWQSFVAQTHRHLDASAVGTADITRVHSDGKQDSGQRSPAELPGNCAVCRQIVHAGDILPPAPVTFDAPALIAVWVAAPTSLAIARTQRSHAWQSRAPPLLRA